MMNEYPTAQQLATALGGRRTAGQWVAKYPAHDDRRPSLSIKDGPERPIFNCLAGCDHRDIKDTLRGMGLWPEFNGRQAPSRRAPVNPGPSEGELKNRRIAQQIYDAAFPCIMSTPCEKYLRLRGVWEAAEQTTSLRYARIFHPETKEHEVPCLIVPRHDAAAGEILGIQRIFLTEDGRKYDRSTAKMSLGIVSGGFSLLHKPQGDELVLAEGLESALAAMLLFGGKVAGATCGPFPPEIKIPDWVRLVTIAADHDSPLLPNGKPRRTSQQKAEVLMEFLQETGRNCRLFVPVYEKTDAVDELARIRAEMMKGQRHVA